MVALTPASIIIIVVAIRFYKELVSARTHGFARDVNSLWEMENQLRAVDNHNASGFSSERLKEQNSNEADALMPVRPTNRRYRFSQGKFR